MCHVFLDFGYGFFFSHCGTGTSTVPGTGTVPGRRLVLLKYNTWYRYLEPGTYRVPLNNLVPGLLLLLFNLVPGSTICSTGGLELKELQEIENS